MRFPVAAAALGWFCVVGVVAGQAPAQAPAAPSENPAPKAAHCPMAGKSQGTGMGKMECKCPMGQMKDGGTAGGEHKMAGMSGMKCMGKAKMEGMQQDSGMGQTPAPSGSHEAMPGMEHMEGMGQMSGMGMEMAKKKAILPTGPLQIGFGGKSAEWTTAALAALPHKTVTVYIEHMKANQTYTGVALYDLLTALGAPAQLHGKDLRLYVVAEGADGYAAVYSLAEVNPEMRETVALVADAVDGKALGDSGPLQMVIAGDKHPARWVRNLAAIHVLKAE